MIVKESIDFKRGGEVKSTLGIGQKALKLEILNKWREESQEFMLYKYFTDWEDDSYITSIIENIADGTISFTGTYDYDDKMGSETYEFDGEFDIDNIESIIEEKGEESIILKEAVREEWG